MLDHDESTHYKCDSDRNHNQWAIEELSLDGKVIASFIVVAAVGGLALSAMTTRHESSAGRFVLLGSGRVWESELGDAKKPWGWHSLSVTESSLAFDSSTGSLCLTNAYPELYRSSEAQQVILQMGPDGKVEPAVDVNTGQPRMRTLPLCSDLAAK